MKSSQSTSDCEVAPHATPCTRPLSIKRRTAFSKCPDLSKPCLILSRILATMSRVERNTMLRDLAQSVNRYTEHAFGSSPYPTAIREISLLRADQAARPAQCLIKPALCMSFQGTKWATFEKKRYQYEAGQALVVSAGSSSSGDSRG